MKSSNFSFWKSIGGEFRGAPSATTIHDSYPLNRRGGSVRGQHDGASYVGSDDYHDR